MLQDKIWMLSMASLVIYSFVTSFFFQGCVFFQACQLNEGCKPFIAAANDNSN